MKLTEEQLSYISYQMTKERRLLKDILLEEYSQAEIVILVGHDDFDTEDPYYIKSAGFDDVRPGVDSLVTEATPNIEGIYEDGTERNLSDPTKTVTGTINGLEKGLIQNPFTGEPLDSIPQLIIYSNLAQALSERAN